MKAPEIAVDVWFSFEGKDEPYTRKVVLNVHELAEMVTKHVVGQVAQHGEYGHCITSYDW